MHILVKNDWLFDFHFPCIVYLLFNALKLGACKQTQKITSLYEVIALTKLAVTVPNNSYRFWAVLHLGGVHKLRLQDEVGRWSKIVHFL